MAKYQPGIALGNPAMAKAWGGPDALWLYFGTITNARHTDIGFFRTAEAQYYAWSELANGFGQVIGSSIFGGTLGDRVARVLAVALSNQAGQRIEVEIYEDYSVCVQRTDSVFERYLASPGLIRKLRGKEPIDEGTWELLAPTA
jgi:hypothetical protein